MDYQGLAIGIASVVLAAYGASQQRKQTRMMQAQMSAAGASASTQTQNQLPPWWKAPGLYAMSLLVALAWMPWALDQLYSKPARTELVDYGLRGPFTFAAVLPTSPLLEYKKTHKLMLIVRIQYTNIDRMTDRSIEKTIAYTIDGSSMPMVMTGQTNPPRLRVQFNQPQVAIEYDAVLIPSNLTPDDINNLADVERVGGRILDARVQTVPLVMLGIEPANKPPAPKMCPCPESH